MIGANRLKVLYEDFLAILKDNKDWRILANELQLGPEEIDDAVKTKSSNSEEGTAEVVKKWILKNEFASKEKLIRARQNVEGKQTSNFISSVVYTLTTLKIECLIMHEFLCG